MKYIISAILFLNFGLKAHPIHLHYEGDTEEANIYKVIMSTEYGIPNELISMKKVKECSTENGMGKLHICVKKNGDLVWISVDDHFVNESLKIFIDR